MPAGRTASDCGCTNERPRDEPASGLAAQSSLEGIHPCPQASAHQASFSLNFPSLALSLSWSSPCLLLAAPQPPHAHLGASSQPSSASILLFPQRTSSPPQTTHRRYLSVPGCPHTSSTLPRGQALKLSSTQSCFPGDSYVQVP